jgi:hypothetical protein
VSKVKAAEVINRIAEGVSMRQACKDAGVANPSFMRWIKDDPLLAEQYARAHEIMVDSIVEEIIEIADDGSNDWMQSNRPDDKGYSLNGENVARSRLRVDARKWYASKLAPKKYGDRVDQVLSNPDGSNINFNIALIPAPKRDDE